MNDNAFVEFLESDQSLKKLLHMALPIAERKNKLLKEIIPEVFNVYVSETSLNNQKITS